MMQSELKIRSIGKEGSQPHSNILSQQEVATNFGQMEKTDRDKSHLFAENIIFLESSHKPSHWELFQQAHLLDRSLRFKM